jgi:hypothetical protein
MKHRILLLIFLICPIFFINAYEVSLADYQDDFHEDFADKQNARPDIKYVLKKYERIINGKHCLVYPATNPKRLVISFAYAVPGRYGSWSWFWREDEKWTDTAYLFLRDDNSTWYVGTRDKPEFLNYCAIINQFLKNYKLQPNQVFAFGASAGGYAALTFATFLGFKAAIVDIPNFDPESWNNFSPYPVIKPNLAWINLKDLILKTPKIPYISVHYGNWPGDIQAAHRLLDVLKQKKSTFNIRRTSLKDHAAFTINKAFVEKEIAYIETQEDLEAKFQLTYD